MDSNENQQKNPWSIFSDIDGREIFELLDTQHLRSLNANGAGAAQQSGAQPQIRMPLMGNTGPYTPVSANCEQTGPRGTMPNQPNLVSSTQYSTGPYGNDPYNAQQSGASSADASLLKSMLPPPPPITDVGYASNPAPAQLPMPPEVTQANTAYAQHDGLPRINAHSPTPRFDLESAVVETGVPAMTIRAWERRYGIPSPWRGGNNYTMYSQRDVVAVRWVRKRVAAGVSVRQAMTEFARCEPEYAFSKGVNPLTSSSTLPLRRDLGEMREPLMRAFTLMDEVGTERLLSDAFSTHPVGFVCQQLLQPVLVHIVELRRLNNLPLTIEIFAAKVTRSQVVHLIEAGIPPKEALQRLSALAIQAPQVYDTAQKEKQQRTAQAPDLFSYEDPLLDCFRRLDEAGAQRILDEAFFYHSVEDVCMNLIQAVLYRIGMLWAEQKLGIMVEHFASNLLRIRLSHLFQSTPNLRQGSSILVGCAPKETHELGVLMLALFWRRAGLNVFYLGQMLELHSLMQELRTMRPGIVCLSAMTRPRVKDLAEVGREIVKMAPPKPIFCFGGGAFGRDEGLIRSVKGVFLGGGNVATQRIKELSRLQATFSPNEVETILAQQ